MTVQTAQLEGILTTIEGTKYENYNNIPVLNDYIFTLTGWLAFAGQQMAYAKKNLNKEKARAYETFVFSKAASGLKITPSLAKEYAAVKCEQEEYEYDLAERCTRTIVHTIDAVRTVISALKEEMRTVNFQQNI
ncbi:hypothetical protein [Chitinophaga pinensis]|uniref:Uncharacterized protein n=1 Tax=Chitinophaga pinensis (strain ATCC 43595 / DSM 2588 / LMG 13176 / NBRC 15968 / NCIMB 11800 / UQM 2034) TaxID=485918 RepID=A0A979G606_CHIPD|nr:hypothetical protein [Chitinophaga pinensis]ACU61318.1 hypothetical protein Cpin_3856 [Chitinophaga pinensis DSM 2588]